MALKPSAWKDPVATVAAKRYRYHNPKNHLNTTVMSNENKILGY